MAAASSTIFLRPLRRLFERALDSGTYACYYRSVSLGVPSWTALLPAAAAAGSAASRWKLFGAVCLQRLPVLSQKPTPLEERFGELVHQLDLENSLYSDHELRLQEEAERMSRKKDDYDSDEEDSAHQDIITAEDLEDSWEQRLKKVRTSLVFQEMDEKNLSCVDRCLSDNLMLLAKQRVGEEDLWLLPQQPWEAGETLRQTAERALASLPGADFKATFLGNVPCGVYKYKFPKDIRTESCVGAKVFFFKALLSKDHHSKTQEGAFMWLRKEELSDYLRPAYLKQVNRFVFDI
ncbi:large ribosomal subunit protein mL46 [Scleropages formosus]|uniref:Large ribosomal subunit protein mL46 n=1 Tax=Scleropages formosus TaxID=113540 RepID=A0A8C9W155_SCLFO|nr:39S ribosomal protein L46, mitochondrial [Scleropages formosus]